MHKFSDEIKYFIKKYLAFVATSDGKGIPNVVPKGDIAILDDKHIVFADLYSHQTKNNLTKNPNIAITVVNPASYKGYQLKGKAKIIERQKALLANSQAEIVIAAKAILRLRRGERAESWLMQCPQS